MLKRIVFGLVAAVALAGVMLVVLGWRSALPQTEGAAAATFAAADVARGEVLAGIGNCAACHTVDPAAPYGGGRAIATPFGTLYGSNITSHPEDGIGRWSLEAFLRAMREGVSRDGTHLYPAFPYTHFTRVTDEDLYALYAYFMSVEPVAGKTPDNTLEFPFNVRPLQVGWKMLFFDDVPWQPEAHRSDAWNRGAYLAEGLGHCSACHSPRNAFGAELHGEAYAGAVVDDWYAPALTEANESPMAWSENELYEYLRQGGSALHGVAVGSMAEVVHGGLGRAPDQDIRALASYFAEVAGAPAAAAGGADAAIARAQSVVRQDAGRGAALFSAACEGCHYNDPSQPNALRPDLALNSSVTAPDPVNLIRVTLHGVSQDEGMPGVIMPGFADALSDADIATLASFLRASHSAEAPWENLTERVAALRRNTE